METCKAMFKLVNEDMDRWKPITGGLTSDTEYLTNMHRFNDPNDSMTRLTVFGRVSANNTGRSAEGKARKFGCLIKTYLIDSSDSFYKYVANLHHVML
jgi:hypothetical protein